jgi:hypothetical protein
VAVYEELKKYRIEQKISLEFIAEKTKIALDILQSLDAGHYDVLPLPYARLFLLSYAKVIGYPREDIMRQLEVELASPRKNTDIKVVSPDSEVEDFGHHQSNINNALFDNDSLSNSNLIKVFAAVFIIILFIVIGKNIILPSNSDSNLKEDSQILMDINEQVTLDSLSFTFHDSLVINILSMAKLHIIYENDQKQKDTLRLKVEDHKTFLINDLNYAILWPSNSAFVSIGNDTLPNQFKNSGEGISIRKIQNRLVLASHPSY